jgi:cytochrome c biogenesis factor
MKKALSIFVQFFLFFATFAAGIIIGALNPHKLHWFVTHPTPASTRYFDPTGLILTLLLYILILIIEAARKTVRTSGVRTTIALALALIAGFVLKFGFAG